MCAMCILLKCIATQAIINTTQQVELSTWLGNDTRKSEDQRSSLCPVELNANPTFVFQFINFTILHYIRTVRLVAL